MKTYSQAKGRGNSISKAQIKTIHTLTSALGMDDDEYRGLLSSTFEVTSCKSLSWRQAEQLIDDLQAKKGTPAPKVKKPLPFADLDGRPGMASGAQCRMIAAMWGEVSRGVTSKQRAQGLDHFIGKICGVSSIRFLKREQVEKMVKAIKSMKEVQDAGEVAQEA